MLTLSTLLDAVAASAETSLSGPGLTFVSALTEILEEARPSKLAVMKDPEFPAIKQAIFRVLVSIPELTPGAQTLLDPEMEIGHALSIVFGDKLFKARLREGARDFKSVALVNEAIKLGANFDLIDKIIERERRALLGDSSGIEPLPNVSLPSPPCADRGSATAPRSLAFSSPRPALRPVFSRPPNLGQMHRPGLLNEGPLSTTADKTIGALDIKIQWIELSGQLQNKIDPAKSIKIISQLFNDGHNNFLFRLEEEISAGKIVLASVVEFHALLTLVRLYSRMNASRSAYNLAKKLWSTRQNFGDVKPGEIARLRSLLGRTALRSGNIDEAIDIYRDVFYENPKSPDNLSNYIGAVFGRDKKLASRLCSIALINNYNMSDDDWVFIADLQMTTGSIEKAHASVLRMENSSQRDVEGAAALANIALFESNRIEWSAHLRNYFAHSLGRDVLTYRGDDLQVFGFQQSVTDFKFGHSKISVVMTSFNASETIERAIRSVLNQSYANLELIIADDVSSDGSRDIIVKLAQEDPRIKYIFATENHGTYAAKNGGIAISTGEFVTFHDSDDWMHPLRLEFQVAAMTPDMACSTCRWLRMAADGRIIVRRGGPYSHLNPASTFFRRAVLERIGPFDPVRTGADSEITARVQHTYGKYSLHNLNYSLGLGLHHEKSLTQSGATAFDEYRFSPIRLEYTESWLRWHVAKIKSQEALKINPGQREFSAPAEILP
jgi:tetratricopeptide (TPR) repeat protein